MFEWWFVIFFWFNPLYWIIGLAVTYEGKSLEDKIFRAFTWLMIPFLSPLRYCCLAALLLFSTLLT